MNDSAQTKSPEEMYHALRSMTLSARPEQVGLVVASPDEPYLVLMETGLAEGVITLIAVFDGSASMYFSKGGGFMGGHAHEAIRNAAQAFVEESEEYLNEMCATTEFPLPALGSVRFYVLTPSAIYTAVDDEQALGLGQSPLTPLFFAGQRVITEYRLMSQSQSNS